MVIKAKANQVKKPAVPVAVTALEPIVPTHIISVKLYAICISEVPIIGSANIINFFKILPSVKFVFKIYYLSFSKLSITSA